MKGIPFSAELPFVGRSVEQERFRELMRTRDHNTSKQVIVISGPGGHGKSWLAGRFRQIAQDEFLTSVVAIDWGEYATSIHTVAQVMDVLAANLGMQLPIALTRFSTLRAVDLELDAFENSMRTEYFMLQDQNGDDAVNFEDYLEERLTDAQKDLRKNRTRALSEAFVGDLREHLPKHGHVLICFDHYELIDYHRHRGKQQNFADMWVQRLLADCPNNVDFIICGRESHAEAYEQSLSSSRVTAFPVDHLSLVEVAKYVAAYLGHDVEALARQIYAFSNGVPFLVDLAVQLIKAFPNEPFDIMFFPDQEGVEQTAEQADEILKVGATRFLQYLQKEKLLLLLACFVSIVQLGGNRELREEVVTYTLKRAYPKSSVVVGLLERASGSFSSVFPEPGTIRTEVRPIIVDALINADININQSEFEALLHHADEVLIDLLASETDTERRLYLLAQRVNVTAWTDRQLSLDLLLRECSARSIHSFGSLQHFLDLIADARLMRVLPDVSQKHFVALLDDASRGHLRALLRSIPARFITNPHLQCLIDVACLHLDIVIRGAAPTGIATLVKDDAIEQKLKALESHIDSFPADLIEYDVRAGLAETYLEFSQVLNKLRQYQKEAEIIERLIPLLDGLPFSFRDHRLNYAYLRAAKLALIRNDFQLAGSLAERARQVLPDDRLTIEFQLRLPHLKHARAEVLMARAMDRVRILSRVDPESIRELEEAAQLAPDNANIYRNLIRLYRRDRRYPQALEASRRLLEIEPLNVSGIIGRGEVLYETGAFAEAEHTFKHALSVVRESGEEEVLNVYTNLGRCCVVQERYDEALQYFDRRIEGGLKKVDYFATAAENLQKLTGIQRNYLKHVYNRKAYVLLAMGKLDEARSQFQSVLEMDGTYHEAWLGLSIIDGGNNAEDVMHGIKACRGNISRTPAKVSSYFHLAFFYLLSGTFTDRECEGHFQKALTEAYGAMGFVFEAIFVLRIIARHIGAPQVRTQLIQSLLATLESHVHDPGIELPPPTNERAQAHVFISYSSEDRASFVDRLAEDLEHHGYQIWVDNLDPRYGGIVGGYEWRQALANALNAAAVVILVLTPDSIQSGWVRAEVRLAGALEKPIVPVIARSVEHNLLKGFHVANGKVVADLHVRDFTGTRYRTTLTTLLSDLRQYPQGDDGAI